MAGGKSQGKGEGRLKVMMHYFAAIKGDDRRGLKRPKTVARSATP